jgi:hypothetical protein
MNAPSTLRSRIFGRPTAVYRIFDADERLLYVGITCNLKARLSNHHACKPWWPDARSAAIEWCADRRIALHQEACAIPGENPRYNITRPYPRRPLPIREHPGTFRDRFGGDESEPTSLAGLAVRGWARPVEPDEFAETRAMWTSWHADPTTHPTHPRRPTAA